MKGKFATLVPLYKELEDAFDLSQLPTSKELKDIKDILANAGIFSFFSKRWWAARRALFSLANSVKPDKKLLKSLLPKLVEYKRGLEEVDNINKEAEILGHLYQGIDTPLDRIITLREWYRSVRDEYGRGLDPRARFAEYLFSMDKDLAQSVMDLSKNGMADTVLKLLSSARGLQQRYVKSTHLKDELSSMLEGGSPVQNFLRTLLKPLKALLKIVSRQDIALLEMDDVTLHLERFQKALDEWRHSELITLMSPEFLPLTVAPGKYDQQALDVAKNWDSIVGVCQQSPAVLTALGRNSTAVDYNSLRSDCDAVAPLLSNERAAWSEFGDFGKVNETEWCEAGKGQLSQLVSRNQRALENPNWLNTWLDYIKVRRRLTNEGMDQVLAKLESNQIDSERLSDVVQMVVMHQLATEILNEEPYLAEFTGLEQAAIQERFREYDRKLLKLQRAKIAYRAARSNPPAGNASGKVSEYTETSLIKHESGKKTRHIAVRALVDRAGRAIQALKPCFMMSPMSTAQYIAPGSFEFDVVVMDEASQIRPEDALGAIARGKSLIVVGDPKQLPPTAFFSKVAGDDSDDDTVALEESESILESAMPMFKTRRLRWHYRSRHESLIAFSNTHFYNSDLVIFPSPYSSSPEFGIRYHFVKRGRFNRGKNAEEARAIAKSALDHMRNSPDESVGVVAMNAEQRTEIEMHIEQLIKDDPGYRQAYDKCSASEESLFVKNLENVQGDERDVIMISLTYGPAEVGGKVHQNFGPINKDVGWRRLNVLFTRSKKRMHIFSSMTSGDISITPTSKKGVHAFRSFLEYCETGHLYQASVTNRPPDSDFEIAVMDALRKHGYGCEPQLGVAGYYLDLAVRDPGDPGRFLMGIECDGATYHSAKSARDRDRLRQEILESLGWKIKRIWSTDWFKNPEAQLQPILNELAKLRSADPLEVDVTPADVSPIKQDVVDASEPVIELVETEESLPSDQPLTLKQRLIDFDTNTIRCEFPGTDVTKRLLRPAMLEALLHHLPTSKEEFASEIPGYLRNGTDVLEAKAYLDMVLEIVADYG